MEKQIMFRTTKRSNIPVSAIRKIFAQIPAVAAERKTKGLAPLINISIGQPHINPHPEVMRKLSILSSDQSSVGYTPAQGEPATLAAIVSLYNNYYPEVSFTPEEVMVTMGGSGALSAIFSILVENEDDIVLTFEPFFAAYSAQIQDWGGTLKVIPTLANNFRPIAKILEEFLLRFPTTRALVLNYPNNPSGVSLKREEAIELAEILRKYPEVIIIIDDVYRDFDYHEKHVTILNVAPDLKDRCVVINSGAKGLVGAPGERIGMMSAHSELIKRMISGQTSRFSSVPYRTQAALRYGVEEYLKDTCNPWLVGARKEYRNNLQVAVIEFSKRGFSILQAPEGAFYLLISAKHLIGKKMPDTFQVIKDDVDIVQYFLSAAGVVAVPGSGFGINPLEGYLRISCANHAAQLTEAVIRMEQAVNLLLPNLELSSALPLAQFGLLNVQPLLSKQQEVDKESFLKQALR
jgi:aspartate aminotransferase